MFAIGDGFIDLFFASKRELEVFLDQGEGVEQGLNEVQRAAIANAQGMGVGPPDAVARANALWEGAYVRYNERAKDYRWRAQALLHQLRPFLPEHQLAEIVHILEHVLGTSVQGKKAAPFSPIMNSCTQT